MDVLYADVLLPLPLEGSFTYLVPPVFQPSLAVGCRVLVPLGANKQVTGVVMGLHGNKPAKGRLKSLIDQLDTEPLLGEETLAFWSWIAAYYCCTLGEVMNAALPAGLKPSEADADQLDRGTQRLVDVVYPGAEYADSPELLLEVLPQLTKAKKQAHLLNVFLTNMLTHSSEEPILQKGIEKRTLLDQSNATGAQLKALVERGLLEIRSIPAEPSMEAQPLQAPALLNEPQNKALASINDQFNQYPVCLLHGYTASGKTELYIHLIKDCIEQGKQALMLVPEIALTTQLAYRLKRVFGDELGIYHSGLNVRERLDVWRQVGRQNGCKVVLGARSAVLLPYHNLGLVVVDEEHDSSYKQQDPAPRYHARNAAMVLAARHGAKTLLGTATPSLESYAHCKAGRYGLAELFFRYADASLPRVEAVDTKDLKRRKKMKSLLSPPLLEAMEAAFEAGDQVILFQNRRGFAPMVTCKVCDWVPKCPQCDVALTYHKYHGRLACHYCGYEEALPTRCPSCGEPKPSPLGFGTEQVEEEVKVHFPDISTIRMDTDTTRASGAFTRLLDRFQKGDAQVLIGTQMVSKGLDFSRVRVVGVLNADQMLAFPDFRAHERAFQLMAQVGGRGGRRDRQGLVIVQTGRPDNPVIRHVVNQDFTAFFNEEMMVRQLFGYPPYGRIIHLSFRHIDQQIVRQAALFYAEACKERFGHRLLGPDQPQVGRVRNQYRQSLLLKLGLDESAADAKCFLLQQREALKADARFRSVQLVFDVDPV